MKKYKIPVVWQSWGLCVVKAKSLEEAKQKVLDGPLPPQAEYIDDSFEIDEEGISIHN